MQMVHKTAAGKVAGSLAYVLSDATLDRMGDIIDPAGWDLKWFKQNPMALFNHNRDAPIGRWDNLRVEKRQLVGDLIWAAAGTSLRIDELRSLSDQGLLPAISVGFLPREAEPIDKNKPYGGQRYLKQELLEASLVTVPANPAALQLAKSLNISDETMSLAFGEHAEVRRRDLATTGEHATTTPAEQERTQRGLLPRSKAKSMTTLSQRIENAQNDLNDKRDKLAELNAAEEPDLDAIEELNSQIEVVERELAARKASERSIGTNAGAAGAPGVAAPAVARRPLGLAQRELKGFDLLIRAATVRGISHFDQKSIDRVLDERYPGHEATAIITKADQTIGTTTVAGWALELVQTSYADFLQALTGMSIYPELRSRGIGLSFDGNGTVSIPSRTAGGAAGGFVAEGAPIRVGRITTAATTMTPKKMGVIIPFSRELARRSTPTIEALVRQAILEDTAATLDPLILDAVAGDTARPAGLLNGVAAAALGFPGADHEAVMADFKALLAPFYTANAADNITVIMHPSQALALSMMPGPGDGRFGWAQPLMSRLTIVESTHATAGRIIAIRNSDFATATGDAPEFDISEQATIHLEDTTPLEIVSGTGPTTADPVRSLWQTASIGVRMLMQVSWKMRRTGMVSWIDGTSY